MSRTITITAEVVNGSFLLKPAVYNLPCNQVHPVGFQVMRTYDQSMCVVAKNVYLLRVGENVLGTTQFKTKEQFLQYKAGQCACCSDQEDCYIQVDGCYATINGCRITL